MTATADVLDEHGERAAVCLLQFRGFGSSAAFSGTVATVRCPDHNVLLRRRLEEPGEGRAQPTGESDVPVTFGGVTFRPGQLLYADEDGVVVLA